MKTCKILKTNELCSFLILSILLFISCQKEINTQTNIEKISAVQDRLVMKKDNAAVATDWYNLQLRMILNANPALPSLVINRMFGYTGIALFEAARFQIPNSISLSGQLNEMPEMPMPELSEKYSWVGSANAALANITRDLFPVQSPGNLASIDSLEKVYEDKIMAADGAEVLARLKELGDSVASKIFAWTKTDLFNHINDPYTPPVGPGLWVPTPPAFSPAVAPYAGNCRPFLKMHEHMKVIPLPFPYSDAKNSAFYKMVNYNYRLSKSLTDDQKNIALNWNDNGIGISYTPMGHNINIITQILTDSHATLAIAEQAYVKAGMSMWDASVVCFKAKYTYNLVRPITYIRKNIDTTWNSFIFTPPHPEYPAAHAFITSATLQAVSTVFGNNYSFSDHTYDFLNYPTRSYSSFEEAARECGMSRVYGGIHYLPSVDIAHVYGKAIGQEMSAIRLTNKY